MTIALLYAGQTGPLVRLGDCLRELHREYATQMNAEIDRRLKAGIPLDESVRWPTVRDQVHALAEAVAAEDGAGAREKATALLEEVARARAAVREPEMSELSDEVWCSFRVVSDAERRRLLAAESVAWQEMKRAREHGDAMALYQASEGVMAARGAFVLAAVAEVKGIVLDPNKGEHRVVDSMLVEALRKANLLVHLYEAASAFQDLPQKKALRFGLSPASTSMLSDATNAQSIAGHFSGAMVEHVTVSESLRTSQAPNGKTEHAPAGIFSTIPT
jgi:hypothetical protein